MKSKIIPSIFTFIILNFLCIASHADCPGSATVEMIACAGQELTALKIKMNKAYEAELGKLPEKSEWDVRKTKAQLIKAQTLWEQFTDANCAYQGGTEGGSNGWVTYFAIQCQIKATEERTKFLSRPPSDH